MPAKLTLYLPERPSRYVGLRCGEPAVLGRDPSNDIVVSDPRVSRWHARFTWNGERFKAGQAKKLRKAPARFYRP